MLSVAAWLPTVRSFIPVFDDYTMAAVMARGTQGLATWAHENGIHRFAQFAIAWVFMHVPAYVPSVVALGTHALLAVVLYLALSRLLGNPYAVVAAAVFSAWPAGFESLLWTSSCYPCILSALCFWLVALVVLTVSDRRGAQWSAAVAVFVLVVVITLIREDYTFCYFAIPALILFQDGYPTGLRSAGRMLMRRPAALAPVAAAFVMALLLAASHGTAAKHKIDVHPVSLLAVYARQYSEFDVFNAWRSPSSRALLSANRTLLVLCVVLSVLAAGLALTVRRPGESSPPPRNPRRLWLFVAGVLLGGALLYVMSGGYSLDSRKKYGLIPIILAAMAWVWSLADSKRNKAGAALWVRWPLAAVVAASIPTAWLLTSIWRAEENRMNAIIEFADRHPLSGPVTVVSSPDLYREWPQLQRNIGFRLDDTFVLDAAFKYKGLPLWTTTGPHATEIVTRMSPAGITVSESTVR
jgi:hypothetical protein